MDLNCTTIDPKTTHTHTIVFLHGRGDSAPTFAASLAWSLTSPGLPLTLLFPSARWVFPTAPIGRTVALPGHKQSQWFDIWNARNFADQEMLQAEGLRESVVAVRKVLEKEAGMLNGDWGKLVLAGISQGAATSIHTLLNLSLPPGQRLGAFLGFSCRMPFPGRSLEETRKILGVYEGRDGESAVEGLPVLLEHCVDDPLVKVEWGRELRDMLCGFGASVEWKEYENGGHWFKSPDGMDHTVLFLREHVPELQLVEITESNGVHDEMDLS